MHAQLRKLIEDVSRRLHLSLRVLVGAGASVGPFLPLFLIVRFKFTCGSINHVSEPRWITRLGARVCLSCASHCGSISLRSIVDSLLMSGESSSPASRWFRSLGRSQQCA